MKTILAFVFAVSFSASLFAQNGISVNTTGSVSHPSAMLDITSDNSGVLIPRMTELQKSSINSPATGLMIYQTDGLTGFWYFNGSSWVQSLGAAGVTGATGVTGPTGAAGASGLLPSGSATGNTPYWDGSQWVVNSSNIFNNGGAVGIGTVTPHSSAALEILSNDGGLLPPRLTTVQRDAILSPAEGLMIYNISSGCINYRNNNQWLEVCGICSPQPTVANAGIDQLGVAGYSITLAANTPIHGNGLWSIAMGGGGSFSSISDPTAIFTGWAGGVFTLRWTITNLCGSYYDDIEISFQNATVPGNTSCNGQFISVTPCSNVIGAVLNDDPSTTLGIEYDWINANSSLLGVGFGSSTNTRALVEINGQCWSRFNLNILNSNWTSSQDNEFSAWSGYYNQGTSEPFTDAGRLYQWAAAMNGQTADRSQGICPSGFHLPSDCEWKYLESYLGMSVADQNASAIFRTSGNVGYDISSFMPSSNNESGFNALGSGYIAVNTGNTSHELNSGASFRTSTSPSLGTFIRYINNSSSGVFRNPDGKGSYAISVRCIKD